MRVCETRLSWQIWTVRLIWIASSDAIGPVIMNEPFFSKWVDHTHTIFGAMCKLALLDNISIDKNNPLFICGGAAESEHAD